MTQGSLIRGQVPVHSRVWLGDKPVRVSADGYFVIGFARKAHLQQQLTVQHPDGSRQIHALVLSKRRYRVQRIDGIAARFVTPPARVQARIEADAAAARQARQHDSFWPAFSTSFVRPAPGRVSGVYGSQRILNGEAKQPHYGVDYAAPAGTVVVAPAAGLVRLVRDMYYSGITLILDHGHGVSSSFLHLQLALVEPGQWVTQGAPIAKVGSTGRSTGPHLDWRINWFDVRVDPALLLLAPSGQK